VIQLKILKEMQKIHMETTQTVVIRAQFAQRAMVSGPAVGTFLGIAAFLTVNVALGLAVFQRGKHRGPVSRR
jgi:hypothetical protein